MTHPSSAEVAGLNVVVTGGTSGLGLALVRQLNEMGAHVAFIARHGDAVVATMNEIPGSRGYVGDVSDKALIYPVATMIIGTLGGVDVLINNASDLGPVPLTLLGDTHCEDLERALATNLVGPFRLTKAFLGALALSARERRGGVVLNISSDAAITPYPTWGAYGASKAALHHLSHIWDKELEPERVRILSLDPGDMDTPLHALAVPDADRASLRRPDVAAQEMIAAIVATLRRSHARAA